LTTGTRQRAENSSAIRTVQPACTHPAVLIPRHRLAHNKREGGTRRTRPSGVRRFKTRILTSPVSLVTTCPSTPPPAALSLAAALEAGWTAASCVPCSQKICCIGWTRLDIGRPGAQVRDTLASHTVRRRSCIHELKHAAANSASVEVLIGAIDIWKRSVPSAQTSAPRQEPFLALVSAQP